MNRTLSIVSLKGGLIMNQTIVLKKCEENINKVKKILEDSNVNNISKIMISPLLQRVEKIEELCSVETYNLVFIGKVAIGKSTAISNLLGFVNKDKIKLGEDLTEIPLLKTGTGRTTLCETEIVFVDDESIKLKIEIEGISESELKELVNSYCRKVLNKEAEVDCSSEIQRAIENLSNFPYEEDERIAFVEQYQYIFDLNGEQLEFYQLAERAINRKVNYSKRNLNELTYSEDGDIYAWFKKTIERINDCKIEGMLYPKKIIIYVNRNDWDIKIPNKISKVIDTRGIDGDGVRKEFINMIETKDNICIICDEIGGFGNRVSEGYLKDVFVQQDSDLKYRNFVLGIEQGKQLAKVNGAEGGRELGKDIKKREALHNWHGISLNKNNMLFYNSYFGIKAADDTIVDINLNNYRLEQERFWETIEFKIREMYLKYDEELSEINSKLDILSTNNIEEKHKQKLANVKAEIYSYLDKITDHYNDLIPKIKADVTSVQSAGYIRGSVNRYGEYWNFSFYDQSMQIANEEYKKSLNNCDIELKAYSKALFDKNDLLEKAVQEALEYEINQAYEYYRKENRNDYREAMFDNLYEHPVWSELKTIWGNNKTGLKYTELIANIVSDKINSLDIIEDLRKKRNTVKFLNRLNDFLEF